MIEVFETAICIYYRLDNIARCNDDYLKAYVTEYLLDHSVSKVLIKAAAAENKDQIHLFQSACKQLKGKRITFWYEQGMSIDLEPIISSLATLGAYMSFSEFRTKLTDTWCLIQK